MTTPQTEAEFARGGRGGKKRARVPRESFPSPTADNATLRHFSLKVCQVVESLGTTTYNEVADALVNLIITDRIQDSSRDSEERNIRRRVYDALNVLEAMGIIVKQSRQVLWKGFNEVQSGMHFLRQQQADQAQQIEAKEHKLRALIAQLVSCKQLISRNRAHERLGGAERDDSVSAKDESQKPFSPSGSSEANIPELPPVHGRQSGADRVATSAEPQQPKVSCPVESCSAATVHATGTTSSELHASHAVDGTGAGASGTAPGPPTLHERLHLPFMLVATQTPTYVDCAMSEDRARALVTFQHQFSIHDDSEVLRCLGLHHPSSPDALSSLLSPELVRFAHGQPVHAPSDPPQTAGSAQLLPTRGEMVIPGSR